MTKCEKCGRTLEEVMQQDGIFCLHSGIPFICERCKEIEKQETMNSIFKNNSKILQKRVEQLEKQVEQQKLNWDKLKQYLENTEKFGRSGYKEKLMVMCEEIKKEFEDENNEN